ncbi:hypothetical protein AAG570_000895 [Ranatra chinensis]|uniref:NADH dehydrogenase [ubiquinone] 1 beta subcomplex subunit 11, mitochondrial n=1 Tax=Ranatra chinensis TaxID=642074 RepID=A0ABD0ZLQ0_9HEMI
MSALARLAASNGLLRTLRCCRVGQLRAISTSDNKRDTTGASQPACEPAPKTTETNWISYGFSTKDKEEDRTYLHATFFFGITITFVFGGFVLAYRPDELGRNWAQREAFLELRRRERLGLPLVDQNYIPADKINLPSDEELGDTEIII